MRAVLTGRNRTKSEIKAVAEKETDLIMIPLDKIEEWITKYKNWRIFIFQSYNLRFKEMLDTIDSIAFLKLDKSLLIYLQDKAKINQNEILQITHHELPTIFILPKLLFPDYLKL